MLNSTLIIFISVFTIGLIAFEKLATISNQIIKKYLVLLVSIALIAWLDIYSLILLSIYSTVIIIVIKKRLKFFDNILLFVICNILLLIFIKDYYLLFDISTVYVPLGVSYYFFRLISFVIEYRKNKEYYEKIYLLDYYIYVFFFPIFLAGPIHRFKDFYLLKTTLSDNQRAKKYIYLFVIIIVKLLIIDSLLFPLAYENYYVLIKNEITMNIITYKLFLFGFFAFIHAYMDLMIYTEISKTIASLLGFSTQENFNKPLLGTNISKFWQSYHMSLSNWTRDYVFFPTLIKTKKVWLSTYSSMMMIGIWHSISLNWIFWAFMHGSALNFYLWFRNQTIYKMMLKYKASKILISIFGNIFTIAFVSMVFVIVAIHDNEITTKIFSTIWIYIKGIV